MPKMCMASKETGNFRLLDGMQDIILSLTVLDLEESPGARDSQIYCRALYYMHDCALVAR